MPHLTARQLRPMHMQTEKYKELLQEAQKEIEELKRELKQVKDEQNAGREGEGAGTRGRKESSDKQALACVGMRQGDCSIADLHSKEYSRCLLLCLGGMQSCCVSGVFFGFSALASALIRSGEYSELCPADYATEEAEATKFATPQGACAAQKLRFSLIFAVSSTCLFLSFLVYYNIYLPRNNIIFDNNIIYILQE